MWLLDGSAMDIVGFVVIAVVALLVLDLAVAGGAVTMSCAGAVVGVMAHPATWLALLVAAAVLFAGIGALAWR